VGADILSTLLLKALDTKVRELLFHDHHSRI
jgi:hypothetical protein